MADAPALVLLIAFLFCAGFAFLAYGMRVLDVPGSILAFFLALAITLSPGGFLWLVLLIGFVLFGFIVTKLFWTQKTAMGVAEGKKGVRGWRNVAANGLVPAILALLSWWIPKDVVLVGFVTAIATASSDTFASELGVLSQRTYLITHPWQRVKPGTNGGVSNFGHGVALLGAIIPTAVAVPLLHLPWTLAWIPIVAGWLGCQIDSVLGALFEEERGRAVQLLTKADVNFLSIAVAAFGVLVILASL
ncbi:MAG TPA: DUF92 domain-containing protein [Candidatus Thermoplasmatota archaeon]|nr:DUF92 domain-containing protein [Candidatus Thermoplasmatota archaeon]